MAESWNGKSKGSANGFAFFILLIRTTGLGFTYFFLRFVTFYYVLFSPKTAKPIYKWFRIRWKYTPIKAFFATWKNHSLLGETMIDKMVLFSGLKNKFTFHFDGEEHLINMAKNEQGGFLLSAHLGNWDIAGNFLDQRINCPVNIVMYDAEHQKIKNTLEKHFTQKTMRIIPIKDNDMSHVFGISNAILEKELVCLHGDRFRPGSKFIEIDFLGEKAYFPAGPFQIASRFQAPVVFVFAFKEGSAHYHLYCTEPKSYYKKEKELIEDYVKTIEKMAGKYPEQWFNYYNFWQK